MQVDKSRKHIIVLTDLSMLTRGALKRKKQRLWEGAMRINNSVKKNYFFNCFIPAVLD